MKLRFIVEDKFAPAFTATKYCLSKEEADKKVALRKQENERAGYMRYSGFILYDSKNNIVHKY